MILLVIGAALNGIVMFLYSAHLLWLNTRVLPRPLGPGLVRFLILCWAIAFFGYFSLKLIADLPHKLGIVRRTQVEKAGLPALFFMPQVRC